MNGSSSGLSEQAPTWPDKETYLAQVRSGTFEDSELRVGLLRMGAMPDVEGEVPPHVARAIRREANRLRALAGLPKYQK